MAENGSQINAEGTIPSSPLPKEQPAQKPPEAAHPQKQDFSKMTREQKEQRWEQIKTEVLQAAKGREADPNVLDTVVVMSALGINTTVSFENNNGEERQWVSIGAKPEAVDELRRTLQGMDLMREQNKEIRKIHPYLVEFYENRKVPRHRRLFTSQVADLDASGKLVTQAALLEDKNPETRQQSINEYQDEMRAFTDFLKQKYYEEEAPADDQRQEVTSEVGKTVEQELHEHLTPEQRKQRWQEAEYKFKQKIEASGNAIPPEMLDLLVAFDIHGATLLSFSDGEGDSRPHVALAAISFEEMQQKAAEYYRKAEALEQNRKPDESTEAFEELNNSREEVVKENRKVAKQMLEQLKQFSDGRNSAFDERLILSQHGPFGEVIIENQGGILLNDMDPSQREQKRTKYQNEIHDFAKFLKEKAFSKASETDREVQTMQQQEQSKAPDVAEQQVQKEQELSWQDQILDMLGGMAKQPQAEAPQPAPPSEPTPITINRPPQAPPKAA